MAMSVVSLNQMTHDTFAVSTSSLRREDRTSSKRMIRVLLMDEDVSLLKELKKKLKTRGFTVDFAKSIREAERLTMIKYQVIITGNGVLNKFKHDLVNLFVDIDILWIILKDRITNQEELDKKETVQEELEMICEVEQLEKSGNYTERLLNTILYFIR
jgi:hypothetical protein